MTIPFLAEIERLINERGSAAILRERITLAGDKYSALERKNVELEAKAKNLEGKIASLEAENKGLSFNNEKLKTEIDNLTQSTVHDARLEDTKEIILVAIAKSTSITDSELASQLSISVVAAEMHLEELQQMLFIKPILRVGQKSTPWQLNQDGRKYLVQHGLL